MREALSLILGKAENAKLVDHLCQSRVEFLIVGGTAMALHGGRDLAEVNDLDLLVAPTMENANRVVRALSAAQVPLCAQPELLAKPAVQLPIKNWQYFAEILTPRKGFDFEEMFKASVSVTFRGNTLNVVSRTDLFRMKEDAVSEIQRVLAKHQKDLECLRNA
jgi:hypothetical protein